MDLPPVIVGKAKDFTGEEYEREGLPPIAECSDGDTCQLCWPGDSGWYQTQYEVINGEWIETSTTAPWQMFV